MYNVNNTDYFVRKNVLQPLRILINFSVQIASEGCLVNVLLKRQECYCNTYTLGSTDNSGQFDRLQKNLPLQIHICAIALPPSFTEFLKICIEKHAHFLYLFFVFFYFPGKICNLFSLQQPVYLVAWDNIKYTFWNDMIFIKDRLSLCGAVSLKEINFLFGERTMLRWALLTCEYFTWCNIWLGIFTLRLSRYSKKIALLGTINDIEGYSNVDEEELSKTTYKGAMRYYPK